MTSKCSYCYKCHKYHMTDSAIGKEHKKHLDPYVLSHVPAMSARMKHRGKVR